MSRRQRQSLSPSLFPFLAVLVCTLGTLILLLALVSQNATDAAEQHARNEQVARANQHPVQPPVQMSAESAEFMLAEERFRVEQLVAFRDKQTTDMEERRGQITHLEDHMDRLREKLRLLNAEVERATNGSSDDQLDEKAIAELRAQIEAEQGAVGELREQSKSASPRVVIVPHKGPNGTDRRPVYLECTAAGLTIWPEGSQITLSQLDKSDYSANPLDAALRIMRLHIMQHYGDTAPPYPLLVVRPDGIETYAAARQAMRDWDDQFGYELVPADTRLAYAKPDPELKNRVELAIREAAIRQHAKESIARRGGIGRNRLGSKHFDGLAGDSHAAVRSRSGNLTTANRSERMPTLSAASLDRAGRSHGFRPHRDDYAIGNSSYTRPTPTANRSPSAPPTHRDHSNTIDYQAAAAAADERRMVNEMRTAAEELRNSGSTILPMGEHADLAGDAIKSLASSEGDSADTSDMSAAAKNSEGATANSPEATSSGSRSSPSSASRSGSPSDNQSNSNRTADSSPPPTDLVTRSGRDWALPPEIAGMRGNAIVRTIRMECHSDRLVLLPSSSNGATEIFGLSGGTDINRAALELATAVRDRIKQWGPALPGGRWQPRLDVIVMPQSENRFDQLRSLMTGSGVEVSGRIAP